MTEVKIESVKIKIDDMSFDLTLEQIKKLCEAFGGLLGPKSFTPPIPRKPTFYGNDVPWWNQECP